MTKIMLELMFFLFLISASIISYLISTEHMGTGILCGAARTSVPVPMCVSNLTQDALCNKSAFPVTMCVNGL